MVIRWRETEKFKVSLFSFQHLVSYQNHCQIWESSERISQHSTTHANDYHRWKVDDSMLEMTLEWSHKQQHWTPLRYDDSSSARSHSHRSPKTFPYTTWETKKKTAPLLVCLRTYPSSILRPIYHCDNMNAFASLRKLVSICCGFAQISISFALLNSLHIMRKMVERKPAEEKCLKILFNLFFVLC